MSTFSAIIPCYPRSLLIMCTRQLCSDLWEILLGCENSLQNSVSFYIVALACEKVILPCV